jgi:hypothetical protein
VLGRVMRMKVIIAGVRRATSGRNGAADRA